MKTLTCALLAAIVYAEEGHDDHDGHDHAAETAKVYHDGNVQWIEGGNPAIDDASYWYLSMWTRCPYAKSSCDLVLRNAQRFSETVPEGQTGTMEAKQKAGNMY